MAYGFPRVCFTGHVADTVLQSPSLPKVATDLFPVTPHTVRLNALLSSYWLHDLDRRGYFRSGDSKEVITTPVCLSRRQVCD
jgi:hypothetical protein